MGNQQDKKGKEPKMPRPKPVPRKRPPAAAPRSRSPSSSSSDGPKKLLVRNLPANCDAEMLELCFESKRKFGRQLSLDENGVELDVDKREAVICYKDDKDADTVLETFRRKGLHINNEALDIQLHVAGAQQNRPHSERFSVMTGSSTYELDDEDGKEEEDMEEGKKADENGDSDDDGNTVEISGFAENTSNDTLRYYFSNPKKGGGDIKDLTVDREEMKAMITFEDKKVSGTLLQGKHVIEGATLCVRKFAYSKTDMLLKGITDDIPIETLKLFIEAKLVPEFKLVINEERTKALVQSNIPIDFQQAVEKCKNKPVEGAYLTPCRVPVTNGIIVTDIPKISEDAFRFYFENKRSGGGFSDVLKVELHGDENYCLVFFQKPEAVHDVCRKKDHTLMKTKISVCPYYASLGVPASAEGEMKFTLPDPIDLSAEDKPKMDFITRNDIQMETVNSTLENHYAKVCLKNNKATLECTLTSSVKGCRNIAKTWNDIALNAFRDSLKPIDVRVKPVDNSMRKEILDALNEVIIPDPDQVSLFYPEGSSDIVLVGMQNHMLTAWKNIDKAITEVQNKIQHDRALVEERRKLNLPWKVAYVQNKLIRIMKNQYRDLEISLKEDIAEVCFKGKREDVTQALIEMFQELGNVQERRYQVGEERSNLLNKQEVKDKIHTKMRSQGVECIWDVIGNELLIYGENDRKNDNVRTLIDDLITEVRIRLDSTKTNILKSNLWKDFEQKLMKKCNGCIEINWHEKNNSLEVLTTEDYESIVSHELDTFFEKNAVYEESFRCDPNERRFILHYKENDIKGQSKAKAIQFKKGEILLKGTRAEIENGKAFLIKLKSQIICKEECLKKPGLHAYFGCEEGKTCIQRTEKSIPCVITLQKENKPSENQKSESQGNKVFKKVTKCAEAKLSSGVTVEVFGGDITELKVDVLVNATNNKLEHAGGLAAVIVHKGGKSIQDECSEHVSSKGQLKEGDVFVSKAGNLPCKAIAHALGPFWRGGSNREEDVLKHAIEKCIEKTEKRNYTSIAIPALSTGAYHYPANKACSAILEQVVNQKHMKSVQKVILCDINEETVKCFVEALKEKATDVKVHYTFSSFHHGPKWLHTEDSARRQSREKERRSSSGSAGRGGSYPKVEVVQDELSKQRVDVIVNSTSKDLRLDQGLASKALARAAGGGLQSECNSNFPDGIKNVGYIAITGGYRLKCKKVYHVAVNSYEKGHGALKGLWSVVENCLIEANRHGATSIAFPPIGCGAQKYPVKEAASTMFQCISKFIEKTPDTCIRRICVVIFTEDDEKHEVFLSEYRNFKFSSRPSRQNSGMSRKQRPKYGQVVNISKDSAQFRIGCLDVNVQQGDITGESTNAIVASCNLELDMTKGAVTRALLQQGGDEIRKDCEKQKSTMKSDGIAVTCAGQLNTTYIIHIDTKYKVKQWLHPVELCLKKAEEMGLKSVAFPTLGVSVGCSPEDIADVMHEAMTNFTKNNVIKSLQEVRIIVFQTDKLNPFIGAMKEAIVGTGTDRKGRTENRQKSHSTDTQSNQTGDTMTVRVYAEGDNNIAKALKQLKKAVQDEWIVSDFKDSVLFTMPQHKIDQILQEGKSHNIQVDLDRDLGEIKFHGLVKHIMPVKDKINEIIRKHEKSKHEHQQAKLLSNIVKWFYLKGDKQYKFPDEWNKKIEEAFNKKLQKIQVKDRSGGEYEIDFHSMTEYNVKNRNEHFTVIRRDIIQESSKELPKNWKQMAEDQNLMLVDLKQSDKEYQTILQDFSKSLQRSPSIVKIERIQNQTLYTQYAAKRKQMNQQNTHIKTNERVLWHGTAVDAVTSINHHGFNRSYCGKNATALGYGVYFAVQTAYSDQPTYSPPDSQGHKRMYRCLVLTGDFCNGNSSLRVPPPKQGSQSHILYDSVTNSTSNPIMFVIFHDCQAYPEYIITYK